MYTTLPPRLPLQHPSYPRPCRTIFHLILKSALTHYISRLRIIASTPPGPRFTRFRTSLIRTWHRRELNPGKSGLVFALQRHRHICVCYESQTNRCCICSSCSHLFVNQKPQIFDTYRVRLLDTMPSRLAAPVLTVDAGKMHKVDPRNVESLFGMWTGKWHSLAYRVGACDLTW